LKPDPSAAGAVSAPPKNAGVPLESIEARFAASCAAASRSSVFARLLAVAESRKDVSEPVIERPEPEGINPFFCASITFFTPWLATSAITEVGTKGNMCGAFTSSAG
jgi:hypothetical protein